MSFWGIEVKPGKPVTHYFDPRRGRLRISQATLGIGDGVTKSMVVMVQCNVGNKTPVFLCALLPDKTESCHLDLEFEEAEDVIFSVLGPRSVHLTGYYVSNKSLLRNDSDTESYGEDIANTDNEVSNQGGDEDDFDEDDSFINDDYDLDVVTSSPAFSDGDEGVLFSPKGKHPENRKGNRKKLKKKHKVLFESEEDNNSQENEDEDNCHSKIPTRKYYLVESEDDNNAHESKGEESCLLSSFKNETPASGEDDRVENVDAMNMTSMSNIIKDQFISGIGNQILAPEHDSGIEKTTMPSKSEDAKSLDVGVRDQEDKEHQVLIGTERVQKVASDMNIVDQSDSLEPPAEEQVENSSQLTKNGSEEMRLHECKDSSPGNDAEEVKKVVEATDMDKDLLATEDNELTSTRNIVDHSDSLEPNDEVKAENRPELKKRKKGSEGVRLNECKDSSPDDAVEEVKLVVEATDMDTDLLATTEDNKVPTSIQNVVDRSDSLEPHAEGKAERGPKLKKRKKSTEGVKLNKSKDSSTGDTLEEAKQVDETTNVDKDLPATTDDKKVLTSTRSTDVDSDVADGCQPEKKLKKKKKKKTKVKFADTTSILESDMTGNETLAKSQDKGPNPESSQVRTLSNGLTIEDLAKGKADGKVATSGRKVKVYYTGMLKENGHVFYSNFGKAAYKFCLGDKEVLEGWNIGLEGMRVGDKRRLTIPPTMGYGSKGLGENIPPNSWLIYEVELVGVRG